MLNWFNRFILTLYNQLVVSCRFLPLLGVFILFTVVIQLLTGIFLSFSLVNDPMIVPLSRNTEDMDLLYIDDFFWLHERGVDFIFIFTYTHLFRKLFLKSYQIETENAWLNGSGLFLLIHLIIFTGLSLCCTHLSDITVKIAANILSTLTAKYGDLVSVVFPNSSLNSDTLIRLMYLHYTTPFLLLLLTLPHMVEMHTYHKERNILDQRRIMFNWAFDILKEELVFYVLLFSNFFLWAVLFLSDNEPISYEIFMWGDLGIVTDIRFLSVAPHWYFRAYMAWLIFCPHHYIGVFGMLYYFIIIVFQPQRHKHNRAAYNRHFVYRMHDTSIISKLGFYLFFLSCLYVSSFLPYGRFFTAIHGNIATTVSFFYIFIFLTYELDNIWAAYMSPTREHSLDIMRRISPAKKFSFKTYEY